MSGNPSMMSRSTSAMTKAAFAEWFSNFYRDEDLKHGRRNLTTGTETPAAGTERQPRPKESIMMTLEEKKARYEDLLAKHGPNDGAVIELAAEIEADEKLTAPPLVADSARNSADEPEVE